MINKNDKIIEVKLYSPHVSNFLFEREDGSRYVMLNRKNIEYWELIQDSTDNTKWLWGDKIPHTKETKE